MGMGIIKFINGRLILYSCKKCMDYPSQIIFYKRYLIILEHDYKNEVKKYNKIKKYQT